MAEKSAEQWVKDIEDLISPFTPAGKMEFQVNLHFSDKPSKRVFFHHVKTGEHVCLTGPTVEKCLELAQAYTTMENIVLTFQPLE